MTELRGSCACGSIVYEVQGKLTDCCFCHCEICQKLTGSAAGAYGSASRSQFVWIKGDQLLSTYKPTADSRRHFCSSCGSFLLTEHTIEPDNVFISLGSLDKATELKLEYHQFTKSKAKWNIRDNNLPEFTEWPD